MFKETKHVIHVEVKENINILKIVIILKIDNFKNNN